MPRHQKPLAMQKGNLTIEQQMNKQTAEELITIGNDQLKKIPSWLVDSVAKREYKRIVTEFEKMEQVDVIGNLDRNNLGGYCNSYSMYLQATKKMKEEPLIIEKILPNGATTKAENPLIKIQKNYAEEMRKFASLCGMTIDSRLKVATSKTTKTNQDIIEEFGDI